VSKVSVIMVTGGNRLERFGRVLRSWEKVTHPNFDFTLVYSGKDDEYDKTKSLVSKYSYITSFEKSKFGEPSFASTTRIWRDEGIKSRGDYVVFSMADEILRDYDILEMFENSPEGQRSSAAVFFLNEQQTNTLDDIKWLDNPRTIETLDGFWSHRDFEYEPNTTRTSADCVAHINGAYRDYWEWLGWHRGDEFGYLNLDQDIIVREARLGKHVSTVSACYHQCWKCLCSR
jgi:hypothetical protein